eukprot:12659485-Heterocapsa_arctica.AAC.1
MTAIPIVDNVCGFCALPNGIARATDAEDEKRTLVCDYGKISFAYVNDALRKMDFQAALMEPAA